MNDIRKRTPIADYDKQHEIYTDEEDAVSEISDAGIPGSNKNSISDKKQPQISNVRSTEKEFSNFNTNKIIIGAIIVLLVLIITVIVIIPFINGGNIQDEDRSNELLNYFRNEERFPSQDSNIWFDVTGALQVIPEKPSIFLLLHNNDNTTSVCIAELLVHVVNRFFFKENKKWILLNGSSISTTIKDHGEILKEVKDKIQSHHILVVNDLQDISSNLIKAFHFILDQENPLAKNAVYILIININKSVKKNPAEVAAETMMELWNDLHDDVLYPLITRITLTTLAIAKEENIEECLLRTKNTLLLNDYLNRL